MTGVILFRAQPFHEGHMNMIVKAYEDCRKTNSELYIFVGSADKSGTKRNPLPIDFRLMLINGALHEYYSAQNLQHIHVIPLEDMSDESDNSYHWGRYLYMKMLNHTKDPDMTIYYSDRPDIMLNWFDSEDRRWLRFKFLDRHRNISATQVRTIMKTDPDGVDHLVPNYTYLYRYDIQKYLKEVED